MAAVIMLVIYIVASSVGMVLIKKGGSASNILLAKDRFEIRLSWLLIAGLVLYIVSFILWIMILQLFPLTFISPVAYGIVYIVISFLSYYLLQETIAVNQIVGALIIIIGVLIASFKWG